MRSSGELEAHRLLAAAVDVGDRDAGDYGDVLGRGLEGELAHRHQDIVDAQLAEGVAPRPVCVRRRLGGSVRVCCAEGFEESDVACWAALEQHLAAVDRDGIGTNAARARVRAPLLDLKRVEGEPRGIGVRGAGGDGFERRLQLLDDDLRRVAAERRIDRRPRPRQPPLHD